MSIFTKNSENVGTADHGWRSIASVFLIIALAPILAFLITIFVFQSYEVDGLSMETTLQNGDRLIVQKLSKTWSDIRGEDYIPKRYEIVVFTKPEQLSSTNETVDHLIKRVIGLPGEHVVVADGKVTIYNTENPDGFDPDIDLEYSKSIISTQGNVDITVGSDEVFVMGDNRDNSLDSRKFGSINTSTITGIAKIRFSPVNSFDRF